MFLKPPIFLSATVEGDGGIAGMLEELSSTPFIGSWGLQTGPAPLQVLVWKGSDSQWGDVEGVCLTSTSSRLGFKSWKRNKETTSNAYDFCFRLCFLPLLCSPKKTLKDLLWEFLPSGTWSVTSFFIRLCLGLLTETSPMVMWFSFWTRLVSLSLLNTEFPYSLICPWKGFLREKISQNILLLQYVTMYVLFPVSFYSTFRSCRGRVSPS